MEYNHDTDDRCPTCGNMNCCGAEPFTRIERVKLEARVKELESSNQRRKMLIGDHRIQVIDVTGEGDWRLLVNGYGIYTFPLGKAANANPKAYAEEGARLLRKALGIE